MYGETTIKICFPRAPEKGGGRGGKNAKRLSRPGKAVELLTAAGCTAQATRLADICGVQSANRVGSPVARMSRWSRAQVGPGVALSGYAAASLSDRQYGLWAEAARFNGISIARVVGNMGAGGGRGTAVKSFGNVLENLQNRCFRSIVCKEM